MEEQRNYYIYKRLHVSFIESSRRRHDDLCVCSAMVERYWILDQGEILSRTWKSNLLYPPLTYAFHQPSISFSLLLSLHLHVARRPSIIRGFFSTSDFSTLSHYPMRCCITIIIAGPWRRLPPCLMCLQGWGPGGAKHMEDCKRTSSIARSKIAFEMRGA